MAKDPFRYFRIEGKELLEKISQGVLSVETQVQSLGDASHLDSSGIKELIGQLLRLAHTLKGAARVVKKTEISDDAHAIEELLAPFREGTVIPTQDTVRRALSLLDRMKAEILALPGGSEAQPKQKMTEDTFETVRVEMEDLDHVLEKLSDTTVNARVLRGCLSDLDGAYRSIDMGIQKLAQMATDLPVSSRNILPDLEEAIRKVRRMHQTLPAQLDRMESDLSRIRERASEFRLLPAGTIFPALHRSLRDAAEVLSRRAELETAGDEVHLDSNVLSAVKEALLHLIRNAVAHGIEPPADRLARGKPEIGRVKVGVSQRGNSITFDCSDDGRGIDLEAVREVAERAGLASAGDPGRFTLEQAVDLLLKGGITTAQDVTQVSGRGVGLDAVRHIASKLDGSIQIKSEQGRGTRIELTVQNSLELLATIGVSVDGIPFSIPSSAVRSTKRVSPSDIVWDTDGDSLLFENASIPYLWLSSFLFRKNPAWKKKRAISVVIVQSGPARVAVGVDGVLGFENALSRPLSPVFRKSGLVSGAFLNSDGDPQLVLDPAGLVNSKSPPSSPPDHEEEKRRAVLVIDDSLTTRMLEQSILESAGYLVSLATSAEDGMEKAKQGDFRLFIVDVEMPGMNGFEFIERIRQDFALKDTPAILVTSRASPEDRERGVEAGAQAHIMKSEFEQGKFLQTVRELIG